MKKFLFSILCLFCVVMAQAQESKSIVADVLDQSVTGITGTSYKEFSGKEGKSGAVYAGVVAGSYGSIQMRSSNKNEGVVTTKSGGKVRTISIIWNDNTTTGRTLNVYGKNESYSSAKDLFNSTKATQGTLLCSFKYDGTNKASSFTVEGDYGYIGFRSSSSALYVEEIEIQWEVEGNVTPSVAAPVITEPRIFTESMEVSLSCATKDATIHYTTDGSGPTKESAVYSTPITITETTTVKAIAVKEGMNNSKVVEATYTKVEPSSWKLVTDAEALNVGDKVVLVSSISDYAMSTNQKSNNRGAVKITKSGDDVIISDEVQVLTLEAGTQDGTFAFYTGSGYLYAASSSSNYLRTKTKKDDNGSWTIAIDNDGVASIVAKGTYTRNVMQYNQPSTLFACYGSAGQSAINIYKEVTEQTPEEAYELNINKYGYATLYLDKAVAVPEGLAAYYCTVDVTTAVLHEVGEVIPAATAVVLKGEANTTYTLANTAELNDKAETIEVENKLIGYAVETADVPMGADGYYYALNVKNGVVGFFVPRTASADRTTFTAEANKAYLKVEGAANAQMLTIREGADGGETSVESAMTDVSVDKVYYDLTGRRVENPKQGIYIVNGRKEVIR